MNKTPQSNRAYVAIFGEVNSGKSSLFNAILGSDTAIVSDTSGTTTDPITKSMELLPFGAIVLVDTAGLNDGSDLGKARMSKTREIMNRTDFAIYAIDVNNFLEEKYEETRAEFEKWNIPHMIVFTKKDVSQIDKLASLSKKYENTYIVSVKDAKTIEHLRMLISDSLLDLYKKEEELIGGVLPTGSVVIMVVPIDGEAPKGRLILPQVQLIRNCLDNGIRCNITTVDQLKDAIKETKKVDLVVTDSQVFKIVDEMVPKDIALTSFSILMARQKGDIKEFVKGVDTIKALNDGDKVLISEVCTHTQNHEDIGRVKIPHMLEKITNKELVFAFSNGRDFPENLRDYSLVIHCGGCMATSREMISRMSKAREKGIPITNYGVVLAYGNNILDRSLKIFGDMGR